MSSQLHTDCGCCAGVTASTPQNTANRSGLDELNYRIGTHASFLETMQARLSSQDYPALAALNTRVLDDPSMALLDAWAVVADVLSFYSERHVNEGYLRTATLRRSVMEMAQLIGYAPRPGVSASTFLAYTIDDNAADETLIVKGSRAQSIPGPGELPQSFETSEDLLARRAWNNLQPRMTKPQNFTLRTILFEEKIYLAGTALNLKTNDQLLFVFGQEENEQVVRKIKSASPLLTENKTEITLLPVIYQSNQLTEYMLIWVETLSQDLSSKLASGYFDEDDDIRNAKQLILNLDDYPKNLYLGESGREKNNSILEGLSFGDNTDSKLALLLRDYTKKLAADISKLISPPTPEHTTLEKIISPLLKAPSVQPRNSMRLQRNAEEVFKINADTAPQMLVNLTPALAPHFYDAWANADINVAVRPLEAVYALRVTAPLFGYNAPVRTGLIPNPDKDSPIKFISVPLSGDWDIDNESPNDIYLDNSYDGITSGGYVLIDTVKRVKDESKKSTVNRTFARIVSVNNGPRTAYGLSGKTTHITLDNDWRTDDEKSLGIIRQTVIHAQSEALQLVERPINDNIGEQDETGLATKIELAELYPGLQAGRWVIVSGERNDIPGTSGIIQSELAMLANVEQSYDLDLPGDKTLSTITLAEKLAYRYKRETVKIYGNVVKATHGETRSETLGGGDASKSLQSFTLKQPPLTYISSSNPSGIESTLKVYVNDVEWQQVDSLAGESARARRFTTKTDDDGKTTVIFGNGKEGSRLPTGLENIKARYRNGIGKAGNVKADQISLLMSRPLGVKEVINPLAATGGADKESRDQARRHAPLAVKALDRLVSIKDYEDFARIFAGIGKASAVELSDGQRRIVHITIAGEDDIPIDKNSDLYQNLHQALLKAGDPFQPIQVEVRELMLIVISAGIQIRTDYLWEAVVIQVRNKLLQKFSFEARELGQDVLLGEVISCIQSVPGVEYVDVDLLRGVAEKKAGENGERVLNTLDDITQIMTTQTDEDFTEFKTAPIKDPQNRICVNLAGNEGGIYPAQLAFLTPAVSSTLILNQIAFTNQ